MASGMIPDTLRAAITRSFPELAGARFTPIVSWDSVAVDVDDRLIFKFPRHAAAEKRLVAEASLLTVIRPAVDMPVPDLTLYPGPPLFSRHIKLKGEHLLTRQYELLPVGARQRLAADMALFYAQLHRLDARDLEAAGTARKGLCRRPGLQALAPGRGLKAGPHSRSALRSDTAARLPTPTWRLRCLPWLGCAHPDGRQS
jgi:hypothetical protein